MKTAFFDFDNTLTHGDTLPLWLAALRGWPWTLAAYAVAIAIGWAIAAPGALDARGRIKAMLLRLTVRGLPVTATEQAGYSMQRHVKWRGTIIEQLRRHHADGHRVVVVTGAATIYLGNLLKGLPVDEVLGTELEIMDGRLTGRLANTNCVRETKAETVRAWLARNQPEETWGYGNAPHDLAMLALLDHHVIV